jgi:hypothetical protein
MVASSPPPLQQAFPPEYQHIAHAAQVNASWAEQRRLTLRHQNVLRTDLVFILEHFQRTRCC